MLVVGSALLFGQDWSAAYQSVLTDAEQIDAIEREIERELLPSLAPSADQEASVRKLGTIDPELQAVWTCLLYTSPSPRDRTRSRMPSSA